MCITICDSNLFWIFNRISDAFEKGIVWVFHYKMIRALTSLTKQNVVIFENSEDYIEELSSRASSDVKFDNFRNLFTFFFIILSTLLFVHLFNVSIRLHVRLV